MKIAAAEAVETSVTHSLSQDYSNLDDLLSLTFTDSPGFKPFTLLSLQFVQNIATKAREYWDKFKITLIIHVVQLNQ